MIERIKMITLITATMPMMTMFGWSVQWCRGCKSTSLISDLIILIIASIRISMIISMMIIPIFHHHPNHDYNWFHWYYPSSVFRHWGMEVLPIILILVNVMIIIVVLSSVWSDNMISGGEKRGGVGEGGGGKRRNLFPKTFPNFLLCDPLPQNLWYTI